MDDTTSWNRLSRLLDEALDVPTGQRDVWLARLELHGDPLIPQLRELLAHEPSVRASNFLGDGPDLDDPSSRALDPSGSSAWGTDAIERPGNVVGPYRLLSPLGRGGMGVVWLAERADGLFQRTVALKLPLGHWPRTGFAERLSREGEILAGLNHPNIARLHDAGVTADGRPYLALECVEGRPINAYCDAAAVSMRSRIEVFLEVLDAVAYAHGRLVVHRDLKPSNILVTDDGHVRLLDFGVAKLLEDGRAQRSALTELAGGPRTPEYASPEQIAEEPLGTASDVYSLGVVLYELLTGRRPYRVTRDSIHALEAAVLEADPDPPSEAAPDRAHSKALEGDLDTIILKALKKKPAERYASVDAFAQDLRNYLAGYPVRARADSWWYRLSRLVGRNRLATAAIAVAIVSLIVFGAVSAWQARVLAGERRVAATERDTAEQVVRVLIDLFETTNPTIRPDGDRLPLGDFLAGAQARALQLLESQPDVQARLLQVFGLIHQTRGQYSQARTVLEEALAEQRRQRGADHPDSLTTLQALAELAVSLNDLPRARTLLDESLERHRRVFGEWHPRSARVLQALAPVAAASDLERGGHLLQRALEIRRATLKPDDPAIAETLGALGEYYRQRQDYGRAREAYRRGLEVLATPASRRHPTAITLLNDYGTFLNRLNEQAEAEALQREGLAIAREVLGSESMAVANLLNNLAVTLSSLGRHSEAEQLLRESHGIHGALLGQRHWRTANVARNVGRLLGLQQQYAEALPWLDEAVATLAAFDFTADPTRAAGLSTMRTHRAIVLFRLGRRAEALNLARTAIADLETRRPSPQPHVVANARVILGRMLAESGRLDEAEAVLAPAVDALSDLGPRHPQLAEAACELARARLVRQSTPEERQRLQACLPVYRAWGLAEREVVAALDRLHAASAGEAQ